MCAGVLFQKHLLTSGSSGPFASPKLVQDSRAAERKRGSHEGAKNKSENSSLRKRTF